MQRCARKFGKDDPIQPIAQRIAKDSSFVSQVDDLSPTPYDGKNKKITLSARSLVDSSANIRSHYPLFELVRQHCSSAATPFASSLRTLLQTWIDSVPEGPQEDVRDLKKKIGDLVKRWNCMRPACVTARRGILLHCLSTDARKSSMHNISGIGRKVISHLKTDMSIYVPRHIATCKTISESTVQVELVGDFKAQRIWQNRRLLAKALLDSWSSQRSLLEEIVGTERLRKLVSWSNDAQPPTQSPEEPAEQHISEDEQDDEQGEEQDDEQDDQDENSESQGHGEGRDMQMENSEEEAVAEGTENTDAVGAGHDRAGEVSGAVATPSKRTSDTSEGQGQDHDGQVAKRPKTESTSTKQYFIKHATGAAV
ncbi:hypothetical protein PsYK624_036220 [Phanerochaete sordida]|uniref:Uncharacterized protein n=1 Tax=Phanerochaete sordida TaxID=48140 RepID=A0A9P3G469_9APHY|nr:hypothetical protein PsYK624_036220 [Phanerochaete sordida]